MEIIGRKEEITKLKSYYDSGKPEFIALYGRRRVGKTYLVEQLFSEKFAFNVTGVIDGTKKDEMSVFFNALKRIGYQGDMPTSWYGAFEALKSQLEKSLRKNRRLLLFIDELPCFDTKNSRFIKAFGDFWNDWCNKRPQVMLIVCGSATTWMIKNIVDSHGGLHNRMTHELHLHPFTLSETEEYFKANGILWDRLAIVGMYCVLGGIPYYLSLIQNNESVSQAIDRLFFGSSSEMRGEYERLFKSLYKSPEPYMKIIDLLCKTKVGLTRNEISKYLDGKSNGHLSEYLDNLEKCDFIRLYYVKDKSGKYLKKSGGIYQVIDFFTLFNYTFLRRPTTDPNFWSHQLNTPTINNWQGLSFERICMCHIDNIKKALGISAIAAEYFSWRSEESKPAVQIDLLIERADRVVNVCEMKYCSGEYVLKKEEDLKIRNRIEAYKSESNTKCAVMPVLVTTYGLQKNTYSGNIRNVIVMDDLFAK